jgi:hypothetical protein
MEKYQVERRSNHSVENKYPGEIKRNNPILGLHRYYMALPGVCAPPVNEIQVGAGKRDQRLQLEGAQLLRQLPNAEK